MSEPVEEIHAARVRHAEANLDFWTGQLSSVGDATAREEYQAALHCLGSVKRDRHNLTARVHYLEQNRNFKPHATPAQPHEKGPLPPC